MGYLFYFAVLTLKSLKIKHMKNSIKLTFLALAIAVSFTACKGNGSSSAADSAKAADSVKAADSAKAASADTTKKDTTAKADTTKKDTTKKK